MLNLNDSSISLANKDRRDRANNIQKSIDLIFPNAAKIKSLAAKVDKKELMRYDSLVFLNTMVQVIQEEAILGRTKLDVYFTNVRIRKIFINYTLEEYNGFDWDFIKKYLRDKGYDVDIRTYEPTISHVFGPKYKVCTISWD